MGRSRPRIPADRNGTARNTNTVATLAKRRWRKIYDGRTRDEVAPSTIPSVKALFGELASFPRQGRSQPRAGDLSQRGQIIHDQLPQHHRARRS
jgi:hypothetical protein